MKSDVFEALEWSVANKDLWAPEEVLSANRGFPSLEYSETISFAVELAPGKPPGAKHWKDVNNRPAVLDAGSSTWRLAPQRRASSPKQRSAKPNARSLQSEADKILQELRSGGGKKEGKEPQRPAPPKVERKPELIDETDAIARFAIDVSSEQSISRVKDLATREANSETFKSGQEAVKSISEHYSRPSQHEEVLANLSRKTKLRSIVYKNILSDKPLEQPVIEALEQAGIDTKDSDSVDRVKNLLSVVSQFVETDGTWKVSPPHLLSSALGFYEAEHIQHRTDLASPMTSVEEIRIKAFSMSSMEDKTALISQLTPKEADFIYHVLPRKAREMLKKSGVKDVNETDLKKATVGDARGRLALYMWAKQGGKDAYSMSGAMRSPGEFQVEHVKTLSSGGADMGDNFVMLLRRVNEPRSNLPLPKFVEKNAKQKALEVEKNLANPDGEFLRASLGSLRERSVHDQLNVVSNNPFLGNISDLASLEVFTKIQNSSADLPENLRISEQEFNAFSQKLLKIAPKDAKILDLNEKNLESVVVALEELGARRSKIKGYVGRAVFNNFHDGLRVQNIEPSGKIVVGRQGTNPTPAPLSSLEFSVLGRPDNVEPEEYNKGLLVVKAAHERIRQARDKLIASEGADYSAFHEQLGEALMQITGLDPSVPKWIRQKGTKARDVARTIENYIKTLPPDRAVKGDLPSLYVSAATKYYEVSLEEIKDPRLVKESIRREKALRAQEFLNKLTGTRDE